MRGGEHPLPALCVIPGLFAGVFCCGVAGVRKCFPRMGGTGLQGFLEFLEVLARRRLLQQCFNVFFTPHFEQFITESCGDLTKAEPQNTYHGLDLPFRHTFLFTLVPSMAQCGRFIVPGTGTQTLYFLKLVCSRNMAVCSDSFLHSGYLHCFDFRDILFCFGFEQRKPQF